MQNLAICGLMSEAVEQDAFSRFMRRRREQRLPAWFSPFVASGSGSFPPNGNIDHLRAEGTAVGDGDRLAAELIENRANLEGVLSRR